MMMSTDVRASLLIPILYPKSRLSLIFVASSEPRIWLKDEIILIRAISKQLSNAFDR